MVVVTSWEDLWDHDSYPTDLLTGCENACVLFCAAFLGKQDCFWVAQAGIVGTGVDTDAEKLADMRLLYPKSWTFVASDAFRFALDTPVRYDLVSLDPYTGDMDVKVAAHLNIFCGIAKKVVIVGGSEAIGPLLTPPPPWKPERPLWRNHGVYWYPFVK
jgi:hypothetical protein